MATVSVIIPNFNHAPYLIQRIESVLAQTFRDYEIIILDDCSTDDSKRIIDRYKDNAMISRIEYNDQNSGSPFKQWERGVNLSSGKYIWIAESDDFASSQFLEVLVQRLEAGADLAYCRSNVVNAEGIVVNEYYWPDALDTRRWRTDYIRDGCEEISQCFVYRNTIPNVSACLLRKERFQLSPGIRKMKYCGDWFFWIDYLRDSRVSYVLSPLNYHRRHDKSTRGLKDRKSEVARLREYWAVIRHARSICGKGRFKHAELSKYHWIFEEMFRKRAVLGLSGMLRSLPVSLYPSYGYFYIKKAVYKTMINVNLFSVRKKTCL